MFERNVASPVIQGFLVNSGCQASTSLFGSLNSVNILQKNLPEFCVPIDVDLPRTDSEIIADFFVYGLWQFKTTSIIT